VRRLFLTFAIATLVPVVALGWIVSTATRGSIEERSVELYGNTTSTLVRLAGSSLFRPEDLAAGRPLAEPQQAIVDGFLEALEIEPTTVRVLVTDPRGNVVYANWRGHPARVPVTDAIRAALLGETTSDLVTAGESLNGRGWRGTPVETAIPLALAGEASVDGVLVASGLDNEFVDQVHDDVRRLRLILAGGLGALWLLLLPILASVSKRLRREVQRNEHLAHHDALTSLPNRQLLEERLVEAVARADRDDGLVGLLLLDLDRFKEVNDTLGHRAGDRLLVHVAQRLRESTRAADTVARLGGDEFAVVLADPEGEPEIRAVLERVLQALRRPLTIDGIELTVDASIGVAVYPVDATTGDGLLQHADVAMYAAKASDAPFAFYAAEHDPHSPSRLGLTADLRRALTEVDDEIVVHFQPVAGSDGRITTMEALVRWQHPARGLLAPDAFVPLAEQSGAIHLLTARVLDLAVAQARRWADASLDVGVAVNLSARDLRDDSLVDRVGSVLHHHGVDPSRLELEVTETAVLAAPDTALRLAEQLRATGVSMALDDFGTGYSSLTNLKRLCPDRIKIDRGFVAAMSDSATDLAIVRAVVDLAHRLEIGVTAEGVETQDQRDRLEALGCDQVQGYLLSRPLPAAEATAWLARWHARVEMAHRGE
jgi:diguanylate cyclase